MPEHQHPTGVSGKVKQVRLGFGELSGSAGDHIGHFYRTKEEWLGILVPFLKEGLKAGDKCVYMANPEPEQGHLRKALSEAGVDVDAAMGSAQLVLGEGMAEPEEMRKWLHVILAEIPKQFPFLRWGGDMTWSLTKVPDTDTLMEWESMCNVIEDPPAVFLCQYDLTRFLGSVVVDAMKTHPLTVISNTIHENPYYENPEVFLENLRRRGKQVS